MIKKIISGGQTGVDIGGLESAELLHLKTGGFTTRGFNDEYGVNYDLGPRFGLIECLDGQTKSDNLKERTLLNIKNSDGTVIFCTKENSAGTAFTISQCKKYRKPWLIAKTTKGFNTWIRKNNIETLNVAGNRDSVSPHIKERVISFLLNAMWKDNYVFVFGSNAEGKHGKGAAFWANKFRKAEYGNPRGIQGQSYAIVTKKNWREARSSNISEIQEEVNAFIEYASKNKDKKFIVPEIGCSLAGFHYTEIGKCFSSVIKSWKVPSNIILPRRFHPLYVYHKMMENSAVGYYNCLDEKESEYIRDYFTNKFIYEYGFSPDYNGKCSLMLSEDYTLTNKIDRVVIGDHGPYFEINRDNLLIELEITKEQYFRAKSGIKSKYLHKNPIGFPEVKIYDQTGKVDYADYKKNKMYVSPSDIWKVEIPESYVYLDKKDNTPEVVEEKEEKIVVSDDNFVHLHVHSEYSLLDGVSTLEGLCQRAVEIGQRAIALTDHGNMFGTYKFSKLTAEYEIKPVYGVEAYYVDDATDKTQRKNFHIILLVMNDEGWKSICRLMSWANREGFYYKPRVDRKSLSMYNEGLICLSGCYASPISNMLSEEGYDPDKALDNVNFFKSTFGDRFYNEIMNIGFEPYDSIQDRILNFANDNGLKTVCTNDAHYLRKGDDVYQKILTNINTSGSFEIEGDQLYVKTREEMVVGNILPEMADCSLEIVDRINFDLKFEGYKFPAFDIKKQDDYKEFLRSLKK